MIPWIQIYSNLVNHPKTSRLADALKLTSKDTSPDVVAAGMLVSLWTWAIQNAYNGNLSACSDRTIADAARYRRKPETFVKALTDAGWLDPDRRLHDWEEYTVLLIARMDRQKEKTRQRVQRYRNKNETPPAPECNAPAPPPCNAPCNVTVTPGNAPTIPNQTIPNSINSAHNTAPVIAPPQNARVPFDGQSFSAFWDAYPTKNGKKHGREAVWEAWRKLSPTPEQASRIISNLKAWKVSGEWTEDGDRYIPAAANFLANPAYWDASPAPAKQQTPKGASGELGEAEMEAIQRVLREGGDSL